MAICLFIYELGSLYSIKSQWIIALPAQPYNMELGYSELSMRKEMTGSFALAPGLVLHWKHCFTISCAAMEGKSYGCFGKEFGSLAKKLKHLLSM